MADLSNPTPPPTPTRTPTNLGEASPAAYNGVKPPPSPTNLPGLSTVPSLESVLAGQSEIKFDFEANRGSVGKGVAELKGFFNSVLASSGAPSVLTPSPELSADEAKSLKNFFTTRGHGGTEPGVLVIDKAAMETVITQLQQVAEQASSPNSNSSPQVASSVSSQVNTLSKVMSGEVSLGYDPAIHGGSPRSYGSRGEAVREVQKIVNGILAADPQLRNDLQSIIDPEGKHNGFLAEDAKFGQRTSAAVVALKTIYSGGKADAPVSSALVDSETLKLFQELASAEEKRGGQSSSGVTLDSPGLAARPDMALDLSAPPDPQVAAVQKTYNDLKALGLGNRMFFSGDRAEAWNLVEKAVLNNQMPEIEKLYAADTSRGYFSPSSLEDALISFMPGANIPGGVGNSARRTEIVQTLLDSSLPPERRVQKADLLANLEQNGKSQRG